MRVSPAGGEVGGSVLGGDLAEVLAVLLVVGLPPQFGVQTPVSALEDHPSEGSCAVAYHAVMAAACGAVLLKSLPLLSPMDRRPPLLVADRGAVPAHDRAR